MRDISFLLMIKSMIKLRNITSQQNIIVCRSVDGCYTIRWIFMNAVLNIMLRGYKDFHLVNLNI